MTSRRSDMISRLVHQADYARRSPASVGGFAGHKEWTHFCVLSDELDLLLNWSLMDHAHATARGEFETPRFTLLVRDSTGRWEGDVDGFARDEVDLRGGRVDLRFGTNALRFEEGAYHIDANLRDRPVTVRLRLTPMTTPALSTSVRLSAGGPMKWLVVPRLLASGEVTIDGRVYRLAAAPAYHDHNWGRFEWGGDFAWEWAIVLPRDAALPWSLVYSRLSDRGRFRVLSQGILLWRNDVHARTFRGRETEIETEGFLRMRQPLRVPRVLSLLSAGSASDVPKHLRVAARSGRDALDLELTLHDLAQIAVPNDRHARGLTLLCEAGASARVRGVIRDERVDFDGAAIVECNHAAL